MELGELAVVLEQLGALRVPERVAFDDLEARVILPPVGIADADLQRVQLLLGFGFGLGRHPGERVDPLGEGLHQIVDHRLRLGFGRGREVAFHVQLADRLSESGAGEIHSALPARAQLRNSAEGLAVEV